MRSEAPIIQKTIFLAGTAIAGVIVLFWLIRNAMHHNTGIETFIVVHAAVVLMALAWMIHAHYPSFFVIGLRAPGVLQVSLEVAAISALVFVVPWAFFRAESGLVTPAPLGAILLILSIPAAAAWVGIRTARRSSAYIVAQGLIAAMFFYPVLVLGYGLFGFAIDPGFVIQAPWLWALEVVLPVRFAGGLFFAAVALLVSAATKGFQAWR